MQGLSSEPLPADAHETQATPQPWRVLLDTHVLLELWLFQQPALRELAAALQQGRLQWWASQPMLDELAHVRARPWDARWMPQPELHAPERLCTLRPIPANPAPWRCRDPDDQKFLDLACAEAPIRLWSRDRALLHWRKRALARGILIETPEAGWAAWRQEHS